MSHTESDMDGSAPAASGVADSSFDREPFPAARRLVLTFLGCACVFPVLVSLALTLSVCLEAQRFDAIAVVPQIATASLLRGTGPATSVTAAIVALVVWSHGLDVSVVTSSRHRAVAIAMVAALVGAFETTALAVLTSDLLLHFGYGVSWRRILDQSSVFELGDVWFVLPTFGIDAGTVAVAMWFALPALARTSWSLPKKVGATWLGAILLRTLAGSILALVHIFDGPA